MEAKVPWFREASPHSNSTSLWSSKQTSGVQPLLTYCAIPGLLSSASEISHTPDVPMLYGRS
ncbi:MAG: hypothetical protein CL912_22115 [Deltaproteobacteria bacterium]|nr:hypothetical protein [Deltaproteobacteria bacterium]